MRHLFDKLFPPKKYGEGWWERNFGEHWTFGSRVVVYGFNAMHVAINIGTKWGYVCFHPTFRVFGKWWPWYFYVSPDGTPNAATVKLGPGMYE